MNGAILPGTNIAVDFWKIRNLPYTSLTFFLTHLHGDHIAGLTSSWAFPIYCTEITANLLEERHGLDPSILRPLEVNESHIITREETKKTYTVTVMDANHCPGAAMYLFQGDFGTILHTGDFRYHPSMFEAGSPLSSHIANIDVVHLDNTFCSPQCIFPSREIVREQILSIINNHPDHDIVLGVRKLGKEDLLVWLAQELQEWISVSGPMYEVAELLNMPRVFKVQDPSCRIRTVPFQMVCKRNMAKWNSTHPTIAILPTSIYTGIGGQPFANQDDIFVVPYSDHSSYAELEEFVSRLRPASVVPIVSADSKGPFNVSLRSRADMSVFDQYCVEGNTRLRVCSDNDERTWKSLTSNSQRKKPTLRKQRSNPILRKPVLKGVHFDSLDKESSSEKSQTKISRCTEVSANDFSHRPSPNKCCVMLCEEEYERNHRTEDNDEDFGSQGFVPQVLFNYNRTDKENRNTDISGHSLSMSESGNSSYLFDSAGGCCEDIENEEVDVPDTGSGDHVRVSIPVRRTDKETDVCADVSEIDMDELNGRVSGITPNTSRSQSKSKGPAITDDPTCNVAYAEITVKTLEKCQFIVKTTMSEKLVSITDSILSSKHPVAVEDCETQNKHFENHSVTTIKNSLSTDGLVSSSESSIALEPTESLDEHLENNSALEKTHCPNRVGQLFFEETQAPVEEDEDVQSSSGDPHCQNEDVLSPIKEPDCQSEDVLSLIEEPDCQSEDVLSIIGEPDCQSENVLGPVAEPDCQSKNVLSPVAENDCQSEDVVSLIEEPDCQSEDVLSLIGEPDCQSEDVLSPVEDILSPSEETHCPHEEGKGMLYETFFPSEEDIFASSQKEYSEETAQSSPELTKSHKAKHSLEHQKTVDLETRNSHGSKQCKEIRKYLNPEHSLDNVNENSEDKTFLEDEQTKEEELKIIEDDSRQKKYIEIRLTRIKDKHFKTCSSEKPTVSKVNKLNSSMLNSSIVDISHEKCSKRNAKSDICEVRAKSVECYRVKPLTNRTTVYDKTRTSLHYKSEQKTADPNTEIRDSVGEHNEVRSPKTCVTNLERRFIKRSSFAEENSKYFSQSEPVIDLTVQTQDQSKVSSFQKRMQRKCSAHSISDGFMQHEKVVDRSTQQFSNQKGTKRKYPESGCEVCGCPRDESCSCLSMNCLKRRCDVSDSYFAKSPIWFSVKPLTSLSDLERTKTSQKETIASLHNWLERHK